MSELLPPIYESPEKPVQNTVVESPTMEALLDPIRAAEMWSAEVYQNEAFLQQTVERQKLVENLDEIIDAIPLPTTTIEEAIAEGLINESQAAELYESLTNLLNDEDYRRSLLYIPFEFIPQQSWQPESEALKRATAAFTSAYRQTWEGLLHTHDVRANFVDGDVLEVDRRTGDLPRVVKAVHLIPKLVELGVISVDEVIELMDTTDDDLLQQTIAETIPVLRDLGLFADTEIREIPHTTKVETLTPDVVFANLSSAYSLATEQMKGDESPRRQQWMQENKVEKTVQALAKRFSAAIISGDISHENIEDFFNDDSADSQCVMVEGIGKAIESAQNSDQAEAIFQDFAETLNTIFQSETNSKVQQSLAKTLRRLHALHIVDEDILEHFDVEAAKPDAYLSDNTKNVSPQSQQIVDEIVTATKNEQFGDFVYPVALIYGSQIKGYGDSESDVDTAIFIKPDTPSSKATELKAAFAGSKLFWLSEQNDHMSIQDSPEGDSGAGQSYWVHVLFGGGWVGDKDAIKGLRSQVLAPYLHETNEEKFDRPARRVWLEEMEKDSLQYRLMHKGYERMAPSYGGINTEHSDKIDGDSTFWDSGYRRLAIQLYARRVFLPEIPK